MPKSFARFQIGIPALNPLCKCGTLVHRVVCECAPKCRLLGAAREFRFMPSVKFNLNGKPVAVPYDPGMHLVEVLRGGFDIVSPKTCCAPQRSCGTFAML